MRNIVYGVLAIVVLISIAVVASRGHNWCPNGEKYQIVSYRPVFDKNGVPSYKPIHDCAPE